MFTLPSSNSIWRQIYISAYTLYLQRHWHMPYSPVHFLEISKKKTSWKVGRIKLFQLIQSNSPCTNFHVTSFCKLLATMMYLHFFPHQSMLSVNSHFLLGHWWPVLCWNWWSEDRGLPLYITCPTDPASIPPFQHIKYSWGSQRLQNNV